MDANEGSPRQEDDFEERFTRDIFPNIKHPESGYSLGDRVAHKNGITYEIRGVRSRGKYELGYTLDGRDVNIEADIDDFRDASAVVNAFTKAMRKEGLVEKKVFKVEFKSSPKADGTGKASDIGRKVSDAKKPTNNN